MILGCINQTERVEQMNVKFKAFFDFLKANDLFKMELGTYEVDGKDLYIINAEIDGKKPEEVALEGHRKYVDIQLLLEGSEAIGWKPQSGAEEVFKPYDEERDVTFYADDADEIINLQPGQFMVLFPEDLHAPGMGEGAIRKVVAKVRID